MKQIVAVVAAFFVIGGGAVATGAIPIDDNPTHYGHAFDTPDIGVIDNEFENGSVSDQTVTTNTSFYVDNPNPIGANITGFDYDIYWSEYNDGSWDFMGAGSDSFEIPANSNETYRIYTTMEGAQAADAYETHEITPKNDIFVLIEVEVEVEFEGLPNSITIEQERVIKMEAGE